MKVSLTKKLMEKLKQAIFIDFFSTFYVFKIMSCFILMKNKLVTLEKHIRFIQENFNQNSH